MRNPFLRALGAASLLTASLVAQAATGSAPTTVFHSVTIGGHAVGKMTATTADAPDHGTRTEQTMELVLARLGSEVRMSTRVVLDERADGAMTGYELAIRMSERETVTRGRIDGLTLHLETLAGDKSYTRELELDAAPLGPTEIKLRSLALRDAGAVLEYDTLAVERGQVVEATRTLVGFETLTIDGREVPTRRFHEDQDGLAGTRKLWLDIQGRTVRQEDESPFGAMVLTLSDEESTAVTADPLPEEMFRSTLARNNVRLARARDLQAVRLRITHKKPQLGWPEMSAHNQKVLAQTKDRTVLEITQPATPRPGAAVLPIARTTENAEFLDPNPFLSCDDTDVAAAAHAAVGDETDAWAAAQLLESWVRRHMRFDAGIALAPAHEIIEERRGTCSEFAILLASMSRAVGLPSRVAQGYVYMGSIWGGHAWAEVLIDGTWIPLDAAIWRDGVADAARFATVHTALSNGTGDLQTGGELFGNIEVDTLGIVRNDQSSEVDPDASWNSIDGDRFVDHGLGLILDRPEGSRFVDTEEHWPSNLVVGVVAEDGTRVDVRLGNRQPDRSDADERAALTKDGVPTAIWFDGPDIWIVEAEGPRAAELLAEVRAGLRLER